MWRINRYTNQRKKTAENSFEKTVMLGKIEGRGEGATADEMVGWHDQLSGHGFG